MNRKRIVLAVVAALLCGGMLCLSGCGSLPISTMWKMRNFDANQFAVLNPDEMRAALLTNDFVNVDPSKLKISVTVVTAAGTETKHAFSTRLESTSARTLAELPASPAAFHWLLFALDETGKTEMRALQSELTGQQSSAIKNINIGVDASGSFSFNASQAPFDVEIWLRLRSGDGYLQFLNRTAVDPAGKS